MPSRFSTSIGYEGATTPPPVIKVLDPALTRVPIYCTVEVCTRTHYIHYLWPMPDRAEKICNKYGIRVQKETAGDCSV